MEQKNTDLAPAFAQLRNAYRLVYAYHRRLRDLLAHVHTPILKQGFEYKGWSPSNYGFPPQSNSAWFAKGNWSWDLLPGFAFYTVWSKHSETRSWHVHMEVIADYAFDASLSVGEPDPADWDDSESDSVILLNLVTLENGKNLDWYKVVNWYWDDDGPDWGEVGVHKVGKLVYTVTPWKIRMQDLPDERAVNRELVKRFESWWEDQKPSRSK